MSPVQHVTSSDGTRIAYRATGDGDPLVLVHGTGTSSADWAFVVPHLRERFRVVSIDRRGRGRSADGPAHSIEREADDILAVLDDVGAELLVGHSYGALCSIVAATRADRLRRVVLYEPPIAIDPRWLAGLDELLEGADLDDALAAFLRGAGAPPDQLEQIRSSPAWPVLREAAPTVQRELHAGAAWEHPSEPIDVEALFLLGGDTRSPAYLDGLDELEARFRDARRELIPGQSHVAHVFAAERFAALVADFCGDGARRR